MKKKLLALTAASLVCALGTVVASAYQIGDVVNQVLYTDIVAYIDGTPIASYNIDGYTAVVVEDLLSYGFSVVWDGAARTLSVTKGNGVITSTYRPSVNTHPVGSPAMPVLYTDIVTMIEGKPVVSYNIEGRTICYVDDLAAAYSTSYVWDGDARTLSMTVGKAKTDDPQTAQTPILPTKPSEGTSTTKPSEGTSTTKPAEGSSTTKPADPKPSEPSGKTDPKIGGGPLELIEIPL